MWDEYTFEIQLRRFRWFLLSQKRLQVLHLEAIGLGPDILPTIIRNNGNTLRKVHLHYLTETVFMRYFDAYGEPIKCFRALPLYVVQAIRTHCPRIEALEIDLTQHFIKTCSKTLDELYRLDSLRYLEITTLFDTEAFDPYFRQMTTKRALAIAGAVWSLDLRSFRLRVETMQGTESERGQTRSWLTTQSNVVTGELACIDEDEALQEKKVKAWTRALRMKEYTVPEGEEERFKWEANLRTRVMMEGFKAVLQLKDRGEEDEGK